MVSNSREDHGWSVNMTSYSLVIFVAIFNLKKIVKHPCLEGFHYSLRLQ